MITIKKWDGDYFFVMEGWALDSKIAKYLNLSLEEYKDILISNGAFILSQNKECYFVNKKDIKKAVEVLESCLVMKKLTE